MSLASPSLAGGFFITSTAWEAPEIHEEYRVIHSLIIGSFSLDSEGRKIRSSTPIFYKAEIGTKM